MPGTDLVIRDLSRGKHTATSFLEVKLTTLPDNTTCNLDEAQYGSELVIRPDTIVYQAASIAENNFSQLSKLATTSILQIKNWSDPQTISPYLPEIKRLVIDLIANTEAIETPLLLQPIWKTVGKSTRLAENCLDVFVWSDLALAWFISEIANTNTQTSISRPTRTLVWLFKMLLDIWMKGKVDHENIIDTITYNTKNDKAFSSAGNVTHKYMKSQNLAKPRIKESEIKNIILGAGQTLLSPERRFDAIIYNSPDLFN
jgi:HindVP restriction endonuclease